MSSAFPVLPTIAGGLPTSIDFGPSILFSILYAVLVPISIWRLILYRHPARLLFTFMRLVLFSSIRLATFILRAVTAKQVNLATGNYIPNVGLFIAEQVLLGIGFIILVGVLLEYVKSQLAHPDAPFEARPNLQVQSRGLSLGRIMRLMHIALIIAIALGIAAGSQFYNSTQSTSTASSVRQERLASTAISLAVTALCLLIALYAFVAHPLIPRRGSIYLIVTSALLVIVPAYRLAVTAGAATTDPVNLISNTTKIEFWVLQATFEWIVTALLLAVDARLWFGVGGEEARVLMAGGKPQVVPLRTVNGYENKRYENTYA